MSYNGSGTFNINTAGQPVVTGTTITSTAFNLLTADLATGLSTALTKDGQTTPTANIPMGTFKITGLGAGTAATDAAQYGQLQAGATTIATVTGTDTYVGTLSPAIAAYATGNFFSFVAPNTNTGASTINLNSLGAKNITKLGSTALAAGDIVSGRVYQIEYDGTRFQLLNPSTVASFSAGTTGFTPSSATSGAVTLAGTLATTNGGTGLTSFTANGVLYASSSSALTSGSALTFDGATLGISRAAASDATLAIGNTVDVYTANYGKQGSSAYGATSSGDAFVYTSTKSISIMADGASSVIKFSAGGNSEQMRLTSTGLGIGTSSPAQKLQISANEPKLRITSTAGSGKSWDISSGGNTTVTLGQFCIYDTATDAQRFNIISGTGQLLLDGSGNLGLGVTPSAWYSGNSAKVFEFGSAGNAILQYGSSSNITSYYLNNAYLNTSASFIYGQTGGGASSYRQNNGTHAWFNAPSGTAGNAITFTQAMTLDASGNLGIGTTSPTYPLTVQANSSTQGIRLIGRASDNIANMSFVANNGSTEYAFINTGATYFAIGVNSAERARIDSSGNMGIGTTTPQRRLELASVTGPILRISNTNTSASANDLIGGVEYYSFDADGAHIGAFVNAYQDPSDPYGRSTYLAFGTNSVGINAVERARIDYAGNLLLNTSSQGYGLFSSPKFTIGGTGDGICVGGINQNLSAYTTQADNNTGIRYFAYIANGSSAQVGTISFTSSLVSYNVTSDYRLKNTIAPMTGALAKVAQLKPVTYKWNIDGSDCEGFIAHELAEVIPHAVTGEKDAVDAKGNPQYQGIDTSFLVATLTAAIQEQQAIIESLKARLDAANL
jgi:hypothetical protein